MPPVTASNDGASCRPDRGTSPAAHSTTDDGTRDGAAPSGTLRERIRDGDRNDKRGQNQWSKNPAHG